MGWPPFDAWIGRASLTDIARVLGLWLALGFYCNALLKDRQCGAPDLRRTDGGSDTSFLPN